jgi:hypothetical protein
MNKKSTLLLLAVCLFGVFNLSAQKPVRHFLSLNASTASTGQIRLTSHYNFSPFFGGSENLGIGYQLYANHFTFSIGTEIGASVITNYSKEPITIGKKTIPEGTLELLGNGHMNFPVMIGGEFNKFYFKVGVVPSYNILNAATIIGPVLNPEDPHPYNTTKKLLYQNPFQLYGRFEIGGSIGHFTPFEDTDQPRARFYLGGFVDFGITKDMPKVSRGSYKNRIPYAISDEGYQDVLHQIQIGLRFTCLLNFAK